MSATASIPGTVEAWETDALGNDDQYVRVASDKVIEEIDNALCLQMISIRLDKRLIDSFKMLGEFHGVGYQPLMRDALERFAQAEMKNIVSGIVESQRELKPQAKKATKTTPPLPKERARKTA